MFNKEGKFYVWKYLVCNPPYPYGLLLIIISIRLLRGLACLLKSMTGVRIIVCINMVGTSVLVVY